MIFKQSNLDPIKMIGSFPFLGVIGEKLLSPQVQTYFSDQLSIYKKGNIVSGYKNGKYIIH